MTLKQMEREGREGIKQQHNFEILFGAGSMAEQACESFLDQHTAATWKAALNSILESGLLEEKEYSDEGDQQAMKYRNHNELGHNTLARNIKAHLDELINAQ